MHHWPILEGPKKPFLVFNTPFICLGLGIPRYTFVRLPQSELCACCYGLIERFPECLETTKTSGELRRTLRADPLRESCTNLPPV